MRLALLLALALAGCARSDVVDPRLSPGAGSTPDAGPSADAGPPDAGPCDPAGWRATAAAPFEAAVARAVTLLDGRVLLLGGDVGQTALFDPATHTWSPTGPANLLRSLFTATLLSDGRVLLAGGSGNDPRTELYEPTGGQFRFAAPMPDPGSRVNAAAVRLDDGRVLVVGGVSRGFDYLTDALLYAPAADQWSAAAPLPAPRENLTLTKLADGTVLAAGGDTVHDNATDSYAEAWRYDPRANHWTAVGPMFHARSVHTATLLIDGRVFLAGGLKHLGAPDPLYGTELFDPATNAFTPGPLLRHARYAHGAQRLPDGTVLLFGGFQEGGAREYPESEELFDPAAGAFHNVGRLVETRAYPASALLGRQVLVATGTPVPGRSHFLSSAELYGCP